MNKLSRFLVATFALSAFSVAGQGAPGDVAGYYPNRGLFLQEAPEPGGAITDLIVEADGSVVVATGPNFTIARFTPDGLRDPTFGDDDGDTEVDGDGIASIPGVGNLAAITRQADGKYVAVGREKVSNYNFNFVILRFNADGSPDTTFDGDGKVLFSIANGDYLDAVVVEPNGAIVVAGWSGSSGAVGATGLYPVLYRRTATGAADTTFGNLVSPTDPLLGRTGQVTLPLVDMAPATSARWRALLRDAAGKFYVVGSVSNEESWTPLIARYTNDGALDLGYDVDGWAKLELSAVAGIHEDSGITALVPAPDGGLFLAGRSQYDYVVYKLQPGQPLLDTNYASQGRAKINIAQSDGYYGVQMARQNNGKIVVAGASDFDHSAAWDLHATAVRLTSDGLIDNTFHQDGRTIIPLSGLGNNGFYAMGLRADGDIIAGGVRDGSADEGDQSLGALAWIEGDRAGNPDLACGIEGVSLLSANSSSEYGRAVLPTADGGFLAVTDFNTYKFDGNNKAVAGYNHEGGGGYITSATFDNNGMTVVAGYTLNGEFMIARHDADGRLDKSFGMPAGNGQRTGRTFVSLGGASIAYGVMVQPHDNRIVVVGRTQQGGNTKFSLVRLNEDGGLDAATETTNPDGTITVHEGFGGDGIVVTPEAGNSSQAFDVAIDSQNRLVVVGVANPNYGYFVVARYLENGALDTSFAANQVVVPNKPAPIDGIFTIEQGYRDRAHAVRILPDDGVLVAGQIGKGLTSALALLRLSAAGEVAGNTTIPVPGDFDVGIHDLGLTVQADGKYVLAGYVRDTNTSDGDQGQQALLVRVNTNFTLDESFGADGLRVMNPSPGNLGEEFRAIAVRSDGRIVALGYVTPSVGSATAAAICIHP